jgi:hypothetical protein
MVADQSIDGHECCGGYGREEGSQGWREEGAQGWERVVVAAVQVTIVVAVAEVVAVVAAEENRYTNRYSHPPYWLEGSFHSHLTHMEAVRVAVAVAAAVVLSAVVPLARTNCKGERHLTCFTCALRAISTRR